MKGIRKMGLIAALATCVTVGGVYATWLYAGNDVADYTDHKTVSLVAAQLTGSYGEYSFNRNDIEIMIDQEATGDYTPVLAITGDLVIKFTLNDNVPLEIVENGIKTTVTFTSANQYEGTDIFTFGTPIEIGAVNSGGERVWTKEESSKVFSYTITNEMLADMIKISEGFYLDTKTKYDAFNAVLTGINITVSDGIISA